MYNKNITQPANNIIENNYCAAGAKVRSDGWRRAAAVRPSSLPDRPTAFGRRSRGKNNTRRLQQHSWRSRAPWRARVRGGSVYAAFAARTADGRRRQRRLVRRLGPQIRLTHKMFAARGTTPPPFPTSWPPPTSTPSSSLFRPVSSSASAVPCRPTSTARNPAERSGRARRRLRAGRPDAAPTRPGSTAASPCSTCSCTSSSPPRSSSAYGGLRTNCSSTTTNTSTPGWPPVCPSPYN